MDLKKLLIRQVNLAWFQLLTYAIVLIGLVIISQVGNAGVIVAAIGAAAFVALWILGIVNAVQINNITNNSTLLIVFAAITLFIGHIIVAHKEKNKHEYFQNREAANATLDVEIEIALAKKDLKEGKITIDGYQARLDKIQEAINKK